MKTKTIKQTVILPCSPKEAYEALMDSKQHAAFTGYPAKISKKVGGKFTASGNYIHGKNLELIPGKKIVQEWYGSNWPKGSLSKVTFEFSKTKIGTKLIFTHEGVPDKFVKDIADGWKEYYWEPLKEYLDK